MAELKGEFELAGVPQLTVHKLAILSLVSQAELTGRQVADILELNGFCQNYFAFGAIVRKLREQGFLEVPTGACRGKDKPLQVSSSGRRALELARRFSLMQPICLPALNGECADNQFLEGSGP